MIQAPPGWTVQPRADGYTLFPPEGPTLGAIRYRERARPLCPPVELVAARLRALPAVVDVRLAPPEELVTLEGEYGALWTARGRRDGSPVQLDFGFSFGDDFCARVEAVCQRPDAFARMTALTRELVLTDSHALGVRRRRFRYTPPPGWQPLVRGLDTDWIPPGFPDDWALVTVHAATPARLVAAALPGVLARAAERGFAVDEEQPARALAAGDRLRGVAHEVVGRRQGRRALRALAALIDDVYLYGLELVSQSPERWPAHRQALDRFVVSVQALPLPGPREAGVLAHLAD